MKYQGQSHSLRTFAWAFTLLLLAVCTAQLGFAQQGAPAGAGATSPAEATAPPATAMEEPSTAPAKAGTEGIKVHGHWIINVKNPDGTLVEHREFDNSLQNNGGAALVGLLSGYFTPGDWLESF